MIPRCKMECQFLHMISGLLDTWQLLATPSSCCRTNDSALRNVILVGAHLGRILLAIGCRRPLLMGFLQGRML
jgi:hypothetical protein